MKHDVLEPYARATTFMLLILGLLTLLIPPFLFGSHADMAEGAWAEAQFGDRWSVSVAITLFVLGTAMFVDDLFKPKMSMGISTSRLLFLFVMVSSPLWGGYLAISVFGPLILAMPDAAQVVLTLILMMAGSALFLFGARDLVRKNRKWREERKERIRIFGQSE